ncbi:MAG: M56 family metallopeptidase [Cytophagales bacterium]|nr:MAG: M56 family metallopeptidase [Cytophagales bacterium]
MEPLRYLVQANLVLTVLVLAYALLLRRTTRFELNRAVLLLIALDAFLLPFVELPDVQPEPMRAVIGQTAEILQKPLNALVPDRPAVFLTAPNGRTYSASFNSLPPALPDWLTWTGWLYGAVVFGLFLRLIARLARLRVLIESGAWTPYSDFMLVQAPVEAPFSFGRFVVIDFNRYSRPERDQILRHERVHVGQFHTLDVLLAECLTIVFWINPLAYWLRRLVNQNLEYLADQTVLTEGVDARTYQFSLLRVSLNADGPVLTNRFGESSLTDRIRMMLRPRSGLWSWARYGVLAAVVAVVLCTLTMCQDVRSPKKSVMVGNLDWQGVLPKSPTYDLLAAITNEDGWFTQVVYMPNMPAKLSMFPREASVGLRDNRLTLTEKHRYETEVYLNGKLTSPDQLSTIQSEFIDALFVVNQSEFWPDRSEKPYRVLVQTSSRPLMPNPAARHFLTYLQAAALTEHPMGASRTFSMNDVLEATFFHRKDVLVERTPNQHLKLQDAFANDTEVFINGLPVAAKDVETVHVREVQKLYALERQFGSWFRANNPTKRYALNIETSPHRATRDSSYYVFSPFYSGDF